MQTVIEVVH